MRLWRRDWERLTRWKLVEELLAWYRPGFLMTSESPWNETMNFLTGHGGFLQVVLNGFAGIEAQPMPCIYTRAYRLPADFGSDWHSLSGVAATADCRKSSAH